MSKFFFKGSIDVMENYGQQGFSTNRNQKPGSENHPLSLTVTTEARKTEVAALVAQHALFANIQVDEDEAAEEDIRALESLLNTPKTQVAEKTPARNDPCLCGSGKKYKKCCG